MKIAFWSNANETCGVTANLAAVSVASVMRYPYSAVVMENRLRRNNLGKAFFGYSQISLMNEAGTNYYEGSGIEGLLRKIYRGNCNGGMLQYYLKEVISKHLYYIPQSQFIHSEIFDYELNHSIYPLLNLLEKNADICFIDTASHENLSTKIILEEADLIVVNLCQKQSILEDFFLNYSSLISKAVFLIGNYDYQTKLSSKRIANMYELSNDNIIIIPGNELYQNAYLNGRVVEFICRNYDCNRDNKNFFFMQAMKRAAYVIIKKTVETVKEKERSSCYQ